MVGENHIVNNVPLKLLSDDKTEMESTDHRVGPSKASTLSEERSASVGEAEMTSVTERPLQQDDENPDLAVDDDDAEAAGAEIDVGSSKKKKSKKKRPKSKRGLNAPSGFEEYYVDAPITPAEYEEERSIYDPLYRFTQRIQTAIQRFSAKRRLDSQTKLLFDRYLMNGGVQIGPKMFTGGLDAETLKDRNAAEIAEMTATHYVDSEKLDAFDSAHIVDFEGCLRSFLSGQFMSQWEITSEEQIKKLVGILRNFFNYLLHHDVCPEYKDQINTARSLCDEATKEIWDITRMTPLLPGDFNMACSEIFGGMYHGLYSADSSWMDEADKALRNGISWDRARNVFKIGIAANASDEMFSIYRQQLSEKKCRVVSTEETGFEITEIVHADEKALSLYAQPEHAGLRTLGKLRAKTWFSPDPPEDDLTVEEEAYLKLNPPEIKHYEFWVEQEILEKCAVGTKIITTIRETSFGLTYFDAIGGINCSFYQMIPNELMEDWREIEKEWLPMKYNKHTATKKSDQDQGGSIEDTEGQDTAEQQNGIGKEKEGMDRATKDAKENQPFEDESTPDEGILAAGVGKSKGETQGKVRDQPDKNNAGLGKQAESDFGVEVHKAGVELKKVPGNADSITQENFDLKPIQANQ